MSAALLPGALLLAAVMVLIGHFWPIRWGVDVGDEGYLLYGSAGLLRGELPIRDLRAYDPGRYLWCALWLRFLGPSFFAQRVAMGVVLAATLTLTAWWLGAVCQSWIVTVPALVLVAVWMLPYYKAFEYLFCVAFLILGHGLLMPAPTPALFGLLGFVLGLALVFGLNIFVYGLATFAAIVTLKLGVVGFDVWAAGFGGIGRIQAFALGGALGLLPAAYFFLGVKGFARAYWRRKILAPLRRGSTNLRLPLPWPWVASARQFDEFSPLRRHAFKILFLLPVFLVLRLALEIRGLGPEDLISLSFLISAGVVTAVYLHPFFSRADLEHLFPVIFPLILTLVALIPRDSEKLGVVLVFAVATIVSIWTLDRRNGSLFTMALAKTKARFVGATENFLVEEDKCRHLVAVRDLVERLSRRDQPVFFAPFLVSFYCLFDRRSPVYDIFCVYPASLEDQAAMIAALEASQTPLVLVNDVALDHREERRFSRTHPEVWRFLDATYQRSDQSATLGPEVVVWLRPTAYSMKTSGDSAIAPERRN